MFKSYKALVENQLDRKIKILWSDCGGEYFPSEFSKFCEENGLIHQTSTPYTPQQNGLVKRKNRTLVDMINFIFYILSSQEIYEDKLWKQYVISIIECL